MNINDIYGKIFPLSGIDDNNKYIDLDGSMISSVQLTEPSLGVSEFVLSRKTGNDKNNQPDKYAYRIPLISIDDFMINQTDIMAFKLDYSGFIPTVMLEFVDTSNNMLSTSVVKDGSIIKVYIGGNGDELYYKPIRQDFIITSVKKSGGGKGQNYGSYMVYRLYGKLNVPYGYKKEAWCYGKTSAMQALFNVSSYIGLGFSTNFTIKDSLDTMVWRNDETSSFFDFIENITLHSCYSPNTFFTSFIDQYNILNFVECHSLLSHGGKKTDMQGMIYRSFPPPELPEYDSNMQKTSRNQLPLEDGDDELNNGYQKAGYYFLSNSEHYRGWTNYIEEYSEINNGYSTISDGYVHHVNYSDSNSGEWGFSVCEFNIRPIDNLKRESSSQKIKSMDDEPDKDTYIPLNLIYMTKDEYQDAELECVDDMTNVESHISFGEVDTSNTYKQYFFSEAQNTYQMKFLKKCGLNVVLQNYNPAITKFSRIWVDIYDSNLISSMEIDRPNIENASGDYRTYKEMKNENILKFDDEGVIDEIEDVNKRNWQRGIFNRSLSGWYVVTAIEIYYDHEEYNLKMKLTLNRIEYQPCFKNEFYTAKKAVEKYKEENIIENLIISK